MQKNYKNALPLWLCASLILASANLHAQLKANFSISPDTICTNLLDSFPNISSGGTLPYTFLWDYGNSKTSTADNGYANYSSAGTYNIKLRVTDAKGNKDSITKSIVVLSSPKADYSATKPECGVALYKASQDPLSQTKITKYLWVGQGAPGYAPLYIIGDSGYYVYTQGGTYRYTLIVIGANGCSATYNDSIKMPSFPFISLPYDTAVCTNTSISITATPSGGTPPYSIWWDKKSANINGAIIQPTITKDTAFAVHILDSNNCYNYDSIAITSYPLPDPHWTLNVKTDSIEFKAKDTGFKDSAYSWIFAAANGLTLTKATGPIVGHVFAKDTIYFIELSITDNNGCRSYLDSPINVAKLGFATYITENLSINIYPNPFNSSTTIQYTLTKKTNVMVGLYDLTGKQIALVTNQSQEVGVYQTEINTDKCHLNPGVYLLKMITDDGFVSRNILKF